MARTKGTHEFVLEYRDLNGIQKVAVLCMALGEKFSSWVYQNLKQEEVEQISIEMGRLGTPSREMSEQVCDEFAHLLETAGWIAEGGIDYARKLIRDSYPPEVADEIEKRVKREIEDSGLQRLKRADPEQLRNILRPEHPQTKALILAHLDPRQTANVITGFEPDVGADVLYRMAIMDKVAPEMLDLLEKSLGSAAAISFASQLSSAGGPGAVAEVLNLTNASLEKSLLEKLQQRDADLTQEIKNQMFVFEDIMLLDDRYVQRVLKDVELKDIALSLRVADEDLKTKILANMSKRAGEQLKEEMDVAGKVRVRDVDAAQAKIVDVIRRLEESGEIVVAGGNEEDALV